MSALAWRDLAPYGEADPDLDDSVMGLFEQVTIIEAIVDGVEWVSDHYMMVPTSAMLGRSLSTQVFYPAMGDLLDKVTAVLRRAQTPDNSPEHIGVSAYYLALARRMGWTLTPADGGQWAIHDGDAFVGTVMGATGPLGISLDANTERIEKVAQWLTLHFGGLAAGRVAYEYASEIVADLDGSPS